MPDVVASDAHGLMQSIVLELEPVRDVELPKHSIIADVDVDVFGSLHVSVVQEVASITVKSTPAGNRVSQKVPLAVNSFSTECYVAEASRSRYIREA